MLFSIVLAIPSNGGHESSKRELSKRNVVDGMTLRALMGLFSRSNIDEGLVSQNNTGEIEA